MYIQDLRTIGASFMITDVVSTKRTLLGHLVVCCRGRMEYRDEVFHLVVTQKKNDLIKVKYVCSDDKEDAIHKFSRLHEIFYNGLRENTNNIQSIYRRRAVKKLFYHATSFMGTCGAVLSMAYYLLSYQTQFLLISCVLLLSALLSRRLKYRFIFH